MSLEFRIDIAPNGNDMRLNLVSPVPGFPAAGQPFNRNPLNLSATDIDEMRRGTATAAVVQQVTASVSQWLLGVDMAPYLNAALNQPNGESVRVVFSINDEDLRSRLSDVPFELCSLAGAGMVPLVLNNKIASMVHLLPKVGTPPVALRMTDWPLKVLIVRSNPSDLGGGVPAASAVRDDIYNLLNNAQKLDTNLVQIHILSNEAQGLEGRPTLEGLKRQLQKIAYHILVYLGHGEVLTVHQGVPPVGVLQLETDDGNSHITVPFDQLAVLFHQRPVPVVLLVGCLTAADVPPNVRQDVDSATPRWMRGSQAVAQALINSESGVQVAVGMRYRMETNDAQRFIKGFFDSLLGFQADLHPGHVEDAVRHARRELRLSPLATSTYSWSAPMLFSSLTNEPLFPFLATPPEAVCPNTEQQQSLRVIFWEQLSKLAWSLRAVPQSGADTVHALLQSIEQQLIQSVLAKAQCLIVPTWVEGHHESVITVPVQLHGRLDVDALRGDLVFGTDQIKIKAIEATPELLGSGYQVLSLAKDKYASFYIERKVAGGSLPVGPILNVSVELGQAYQVIYPTSVNILKTEPHQPVCTGNSAVIVPPP